MKYRVSDVLAVVVVLGVLALAACGQPAEQSPTAAGAPQLVFDPPVENMTIQFVRDPVQIDDLVMQDLKQG